MFAVRHGERCDATSKYYHLYKFDGDACLTPIGAKQSEQTGKYLKEKIAEIENETGRAINEIVIETSPFIRTIGTAAHIAKALG